MGFECVGLITACLFIGRWIDTKYGTGSLAGGLGAMLGFVAWITHLFVMLKSLAKTHDSSHTGKSESLDE